MFAGLSLGLSLVLTGCSSAGRIDLSNDTPDMSHGSHKMAIFDKKSFALAMIPHHQQAIVMSQLALNNTTNPKVLSIAEQIGLEQASEIELMTTWLEGETVDETMRMEGMLTDELMADLSNARGSKFDELFVSLMLLHHEGAISMASAGLETQDADLVALSQEIIRVQTSEIETLKRILK